MSQAETEAHGVGVRRRFGVCVGPYHVLLPPQILSEVVVRPVLYPLPRTPRWFLGLLNQRGNLLPVFDLQAVLHAAAEVRTQHTVLVLDQGHEAVGLSIEGMPQSITLAQRLLRLPPLPEILAAHVSTAYRAGGITWLDFDHQGFFTALGAQLTAALGPAVQV